MTVSPQEIRLAVLDYLDLIERGRGSENENARALERALDGLAYAYHFAGVSLDAGSPDSPLADYARFRSLAVVRFPSFGFYNVADPVIPESDEAKTGIGDALDDIADIAQGLAEVEWRFEHTTENDALRSFWFSYDVHLRSHIRGLQSFLEAFWDAPLSP